MRGEMCLDHPLVGLEGLAASMTPYSSLVLRQAPFDTALEGD